MRRSPGKWSGMLRLFRGREHGRMELSKPTTEHRRLQKHAAGVRAASADSALPTGSEALVWGAAVCWKPPAAADSRFWDGDLLQLQTHGSGTAICCSCRLTVLGRRSADGMFLLTRQHAFAAYSTASTRRDGPCPVAIMIHKPVMLPLVHLNEHT